MVPRLPEAARGDAEHDAAVDGVKRRRVAPESLTGVGSREFHRSAAVVSPELSKRGREAAA